MLTVKRVRLDCLDWNERDERIVTAVDEATEDAGFRMPPGSQLGLGLMGKKTHNKYESEVAPEIKFKHGTTTLAFLFNGGVIVAVDSRSTMGSYIGMWYQNIPYVYLCIFLRHLSWLVAVCWGF